MSDNGFDRAPGAGRGRGGGAPLAPESGARLGMGGGGGGGAGGRGRSSFGAPEQLFKQGFAHHQEPLRPPKTAPPGANVAPEQARTTSLPEKICSASAMAKPQVVVAPVVKSKLSVNAPEFYPSGYSPNLTDSSLEDDCEGFTTLTEYVQDFLNHLAEQPACFETEIAHFSETLNGCVTTDEALQELVELIYQQELRPLQPLHPHLRTIEAPEGLGSASPSSPVVSPLSSRLPKVLNPTLHDACGPPQIGIRLQHFADRWDQTMSDHWVRDMIRLGYALELHFLPRNRFVHRPTCQIKHLETLKALQHLRQIGAIEPATSVPNFSYMGARLCNYLSHHLTITPQSGNFRQLLLRRCRTEYENRDEAAKGDDGTRKRFHAFVLFLAELYLNLELTGSVLEDAWKEKGKVFMNDIVQKIENVVLDANCSRDVKHMLLKLVELRSSNWGRVQITSTYREATPENDPNYFMNEPTFYTSEGVPFTAADPDYQEKYQELLDRQDLFQEFEENGTDLSGAGDPYFDEDDDDEDDQMDPEIEEAYEKFCLESERKRKQ
ncbi:hypothetical protein lerEdw1_000444 [Lerista edwardsae]|nr:hypothetical protein lerEdw1_000444 [Lerista edwardsae]